MYISWMCVIVYEERTVVSQCATLYTIISIYPYSLNNIQWISFTHIFSRLCLLLLLGPFTTFVVVVIVIITSYSCCNAYCKVNEKHTQNCWITIQMMYVYVLDFATVLHGMVAAVVVVSKHIIIKKIVEKTHSTTQNKVKWSESNKKTSCATKQKRASSELFTIYARIWIWHMVMLLLFCCFFFFCHIHQIIVEWTNKRIALNVRVLFLSMCLVFFCFYFFFIIIEN